VKLRPAVVLANAGRGDFILAQVTSNAFADPLAITLTSRDFVAGSLQQTSYVRPGKLFTANGTLIARQVGQLAPAALSRIIDQVVAILRGGAGTDRAGAGNTEKQ
jgi:mRNA interferase MazF